MLRVRLILSLVVGLATGFGAGLLGFGLLPTFPPVGEQPTDREILTDEVVLIRSVMMDPVVQAEKRRKATALGIGFLTGAIATLVLFTRSRRWCEPYSGSVATGAER